MFSSRTCDMCMREIEAHAFNIRIWITLECSMCTCTPICLNLKTSASNKQWNRKTLFFKNHRNCSPPGLSVRHGQKPVGDYITHHWNWMNSYWMVGEWDMYNTYCNLIYLISIQFLFYNQLGNLSVLAHAYCICHIFCVQSCSEKVNRPVTDRL